MFKHVVGVNEYIIQIYYDINIQKTRKEVVYKSMKGYESIGKTE